MVPACLRSLKASSWTLKQLELHEQLPSDSSTRLPYLPNPLHFSNKALTSNLSPFPFPTGNGHGRMLIGNIEWILQQPYISCLQRLECLLAHQNPLRSFKHAAPLLTPLTSPSATALLDPLVSEPLPRSPLLPHASTTIANLVPVPVCHPHMLSRSSTACNMPRS